MKGIFTFLLFVAITVRVVGQDVDTKAHYRRAFDELNQMLTGESPLSFKRAVFVAENAYLDNQLDYDEFTRQIDALVLLSKAIAAADGLDYSGKDRQQVLFSASLFRVMKSKLIFQKPDSSLTFQTSPFTYDLDDFWGENDWTKMFVSKLLDTHTGNCHSLPALYKILSDELGVQSWLSITPNHTYIKQWNDKIGWYNTELTTGRFPYDAGIKLNSYIKTETIAAGVYMDTLSAKETIAYVITDLAQGFVKRFGYENVVTPITWLDKALDNYPDYPNALILKAELLKKQYEQVMKERQVSHFNELWKDLAMKKKFDELQQSYFKVHQIGYRRMPKEMYLNWLFRVQKDTTRTPYKFKSPQPFKQYDYNVEIVTAGNGQNYEFFDQEEVTQIGTVEINRLTGKIVRFVEYQKEEIPDDVISRMYDPALGKWWQIDPEAEGYNNVSPYNYVNNNPVNNVDPDGQDWYRYSDANGHDAVVWREGNASNIEIDGQTYNNIGAVFANQAADGSVVIYNQNEVFAVLEADEPGGDPQEVAALGAMMNPEAENHFNTMTPTMETLFFSADAAIMISGEAAYSSRARNNRSNQKSNGKERQVQTKIEDLNTAQQQNLKRFIKRLPANSQKYQIRTLGNGNVQISAESPGKVPGSKALYVKEVDGTGTTVKMYKVTTDNQGNFVHNKNKLSDY